MAPWPERPSYFRRYAPLCQPVIGQRFFEQSFKLAKRPLRLSVGDSLFGVGMGFDEQARDANGHSGARQWR